jgi:ferritin-like metal-binding protein YciE
MKLNSLQDLYINELRDLHSAETQILKALPKMIRAAQSEDLRQAFQEHLEQTRNQVTRLDQIMEKMNLTPRRKRCVGMEGIIEEGSEFLGSDIDDSVRDAALIAAAQRVEHYEIACYGCARTYARQLGDEEAAGLLQTSLEEEETADRKLTELAEAHINVEAVHQ